MRNFSYKIDSLESFGMQELQDLYEDWDSIEMRPKVKFFPIKAEKLFRSKEKAKGILDHISGEMFLAKLKINGFEDQSWQYWTAPTGTAECDICAYDFNGTEGAERYYGGFSARLRSLEAKLNVTVDGEEKECDLVGLALKTNSVAHATIANEEGQIDDLNMFRLVYDFSFIWSPPIGIEIKEWSTLDDWRTLNLESRFHLETMRDNSSWPPFRTDFYSPLFHVYVDPQCLGISYSQAKYFNRKLSQHLDLKISGLVASVMKSHFLIQAGRPHALYKLQNSNHALTEWAMEMITSEQGLWEDIGQWFEGAGQTIVTGIEEAGKAIDRAADTVGMAIGHATEDAGKAISQATMDGVRWVDQAKKDVSKWVDQASHDTKEWLESEEGHEFIDKSIEMLNLLADAMQSRRGGIPRYKPYKRPMFRPPKIPQRVKSSGPGSMKSGLVAPSVGSQAGPSTPAQARPTQPPVLASEPPKSTEDQGKPPRSGPSAGSGGISEKDKKIGHKTTLPPKCLTTKRRGPPPRDPFAKNRNRPSC